MACVMPGKAVVTVHYAKLVSGAKVKVPCLVDAVPIYLGLCEHPAFTM